MNNYKNHKVHLLIITIKCENENTMHFGEKVLIFWDLIMWSNEMER